MKQQVVRLRSPQVILWLAIFFMFGFFSGALRAQESEGDLISGLNHQKSEVRKLTVTLIEEKNIKTAVQPLIEKLKDDNQEVRAAAHRALQSLTKQNLPSDYDRWAEWWVKEGSLNKEFSEKIFTGWDLIKIRERIYFAITVITILLVLLLFFILVFSFMGGAKIKEMKDVLKRAEQYISDTEAITKKSDRVIDELEQRRSEMLNFFGRIKNENESEIERFCDLLQQNVEHRMREVTMNLREKAESELKQTLEQSRADILREVKLIFAEHKEKFIKELEEHQSVMNSKKTTS
ncbi:MAG: HEAT repeat domain-containing protein [Planctomycetota bacterium]